MLGPSLASSTFTEFDMSTAPRAKASDFHPEVMRLFDQYVHGIIDRRGFLAGAASSRSVRRARPVCSPR